MAWSASGRQGPAAPIAHDSLVFLRDPQALVKRSLRTYFLPPMIFNFARFRSTFFWLSMATAVGEASFDSKCR
jgi:hypothetical protein